MTLPSGPPCSVVATQLQRCVGLGGLGSENFRCWGHNPLWGTQSAMGTLGAGDDAADQEAAVKQADVLELRIPSGLAQMRW